MSTTKIEWADMTINPVVGCSKCSPGCDNCYAERIAAMRVNHPNQKIRDKFAGVVDERGKWTGHINADLDDRHMPHRTPGKAKRVFVGSMTDLFHPSVSPANLDEIFASIMCDAIITNGHGYSFLLLTKRADRMQDYFATGPDVMLRRWGKAGDGWLHIGDGDESFSEYAEGQTIPQADCGNYPNLRQDYLWPLPNLWLGVTVCNQQEADEKIPILLRTPAAKRFVSIEPMLGPIDLDKDEFLTPWRCQISIPLLDWVICGGETGPGARPMHPDWVRFLRDLCQEAGVAFFFKGWGEWASEAPSGKMRMVDGKAMYRVGKKRGGRLLDGREWNEVPS